MSKLKELAGDNFRFNENSVKAIQKGRKHCGKKKKEIAHYKQFLFFPQGFQRTCTADT